MNSENFWMVEQQHPMVQSMCLVMENPLPWIAGVPPMDWKSSYESPFLATNDVLIAATTVGSVGLHPQDLWFATSTATQLSLRQRAAGVNKLSSCCVRDW